MMEFDMEKTYGSELSKIIKRVSNHRGVVGVVMVENQREPKYTTMDNNKTFIYVNKLGDFAELARSAVRCVDPEDDLVVFRLKTTKYEIMDVMAEENHSIIVVQQNANTSNSNGTGTSGH